MSQMGLEGKQYDAIISLGEWCAPAANIRRRFGTKVAYPFDWWVCPYDATLKLLTERFQNVLRPGDLEVIPGFRSREASVRCNYYGFLHHHDFKRDDTRNIIDEIDAQLPSVQGKTRFVIDRFLRDFVGKDVLFLRTNLFDKIWYEEDGVPRQFASKDEQFQKAIALHSAVCQCILSATSDIVILSNLAPNTLLPLEGGSVLFEQIGDTSGASGFWEKNFDALFDRLGVSLKANEVTA